MKQKAAPNRDALAVWPEADSGLGMKSLFSETMRLAKGAVWPPAFPPRESLPRGQGQGVVVIPGFLTGDMKTGQLRTFLWRTGYHAEGWQSGLNLGPRAKPIEKVKKRVARLAETTGGKVALVGISLGGVFAREIAKMMPDHVAAVATLCSPVRLPVPTPLAPFVTALQRTFDADLVASAQGDVVMPSQPTLAVYSRDDGVVAWQSCLPPDAPHVTLVEIAGARHMTIGSNPHAQSALAHFLQDAFATR